MILHTGLMFACLVASTSVQASPPCTSIDDTTSDQWCTQNCLHTPANCPQDKCTCEGSDYRRYGFQTSYFENAFVDTSPVVVPGCEPAYIFLLARYGATYPEKRHTEDLENHAPTIRDKIVAAAHNGRLDEKTLELFESWNFPFTENDVDHLTKAGEREHEELGGRWRRRLEGLFNEKDRVLVRAIDFPTTRETGHYFLKGVFQMNVTVPSSPKLENDDVLNFMNNCPKWKQGVDHNPVSLIEMKKLEGSKDYLSMVKEVGDRVGVKLTSNETEIAWNMCRCEAALSPFETSPWCQIFNNVNLRLLDFREDLRYYYKHGYGNPVNLNVTKPIFEDIFENFEEIEEGKREYNAALYFGQVLSIDPVLAALGLYHDEQHLKASDWPGSQDHQWRMSYLSSFAANLGLVLLECEGEKEGKWKVMAYHQERPVILPACGQEVCTLQQFKKSYRHWTNLDFQAFCKCDITCQHPKYL